MVITSKDLRNQSQSNRNFAIDTTFAARRTVCTGPASVMMTPAVSTAVATANPTHVKSAMACGSTQTQPEQHAATAAAQKLQQRAAQSPPQRGQATKRTFDDASERVGGAEEALKNIRRVPSIPISSSE